jgi:DNA repair protein RadA/Sms
LTGEVRHVAHPDRRLAEARKFGLEVVLAPGSATPTVKAAIRAALQGGAASAELARDADPDIRRAA